jgi:hypothetical protein
MLVVPPVTLIMEHCLIGNVVRFLYASSNACRASGFFLMSGFANTCLPLHVVVVEVWPTSMWSMYQLSF